MKYEDVIADSSFEKNDISKLCAFAPLCLYPSVPLPLRALFPYIHSFAASDFAVQYFSTIIQQKI